MKVLARSLAMTVLAIALTVVWGQDTTAQVTTGPVQVACPVDVDQEAVRANTARRLAEAERDSDGNIIRVQGADLTCGGICDGVSIKIGRVTYEATFEKAVCISELQAQGVNALQCFADLCGSQGTSDLGSIRMNEDEDAPASRVSLTSVYDKGTFTFPANVRIEFFAKLDMNGVPTLANEAPMVLVSSQPVTEWPPKSEVAYVLEQPVDFVSADGEETATFEKGTVTMRNRGNIVSAK